MATGGLSRDAAVRAKREGRVACQFVRVCRVNTIFAQRALRGGGGVVAERNF